jgi:hypothetical protein
MSGTARTQHTSQVCTHGCLHSITWPQMPTRRRAWMKLSSLKSRPATNRLHERVGLKAFDWHGERRGGSRWMFGHGRTRASTTPDDVILELREVALQLKRQPAEARFLPREPSSTKINASAGPHERRLRNTRAEGHSFSKGQELPQTAHRAPCGSI